ncbi:type I polyketide synthase [Metabacillus idriensis]|uniref:type I polyketide synthase n=1 Tax=Metabacillus idriensis TaxID=324768 RepID=UPI00174965EF|nr:type I polyketide synthase [Metabacillus idriensis]
MKLLQNYILSQAAAKNLSKEEAVPLLKELFENQSKTVKTDDIAIVGMSCRFPEADNLDQFWMNMVNGVDSVREFPESRKADVDMPIRDYFKSKRNAPEINYRKGAYLDRIDLFDAEYFNITPAEARCMDPLQRIFLEVTWEALEDAGYAEKELYGSRTGVYVGDTDADYIQLMQTMEPYALPGNTISVIASRVAYLLNLASGSHLIDTACSASLAAVHHAVRGLMTGDCEMAVAGGLNLTLFPIDEGLTDIGIASPDSIARTFDSSANGTVWGEGFGVIVLKTLEKAKKDNDHIYAVIKGSSMNSDGKSNGITAPSALAQTELIKEAWRNAGISPKTVSYIEAHGTGTRLGDPIEIEGITNAFRSFTDEKQFCALGAVKTNLGHLDTAAGIAGLIKTVLLLKNKEIPATLHFNDPNPHINFMESPVYVNTELIPWETKEGTLRRAGVSAFGLAGTNCHVILEEYEESSEVKIAEQSEQERYIFTLSAKSQESFKKLIKRYLAYLPNTKNALTDICYTSNIGRGHYAYRLAIPVSSVSELQECLEQFSKFSEEKLSSSIEDSVYYNYLSKRIERSFEIDKTTEHKTILQEYIAGSEINWEAMYDRNNRRRVPLPVYPFSGKRHWINYTPEQKLPQESSQKNIDQWFYQLNWVEKPLDNLKEKFTKKKRWFIFADEEGVAAALCDLMRKEGHAPILIEKSNCYKKINSDHYHIRPSAQEDYLELLNLSKEDSTELDGIIHLWTTTEIRSSLRNLNDLNNSQDEGVLSLLLLLKALKSYDVSQSIEIKVISNYVNLVAPEDSYIYPEKSTLWGLMKVVAQEFSTYRCSCLDIETIGREVLDVAFEVYQELKDDTAFKDHVSAWRNGKRYTQQLDRMKISDFPKRDIKVRNDGVYLIAGGAGDVGFETCRYLAKQAKVKLVLINRLPLPERNKWEETLIQHTDDKTVNRIRSLIDLEQTGAEVYYYSSDISNLDEMKEIVKDIEVRHGQIHGIINATMDLDESFLEHQEKTRFLQTMKSKIHGTWVLNEVTKEQELDFFLLFSSVSSFLGGEGLGSYAASNAFMDQYAKYQSLRGRDIMAIDWSYLEMGATTEQLAATNALSRPISSEEYGQVLNRIFKYHLTQPVIANIRSHDLAQVLTLLNIRFSASLTQELNQSESMLFDAETATKILASFHELKKLITSNDEINDILKRNIELGASLVSFEEDLHNSFKAESASSKEIGNERLKIKVTLKGSENGKYNETENRLGQIWAEVLGYEEINIHTDFFENGDSLMLMSVINQIKDQFDIEIPIQVFFQEPTVFGLSQWIDELNENDNSEEDEITILPREFAEK